MTGISGSSSAAALMQQLLLQMTQSTTGSSAATQSASGSAANASSLFSALDTDADEGCAPAQNGFSSSSAFQKLGAQAQAALLSLQEQSSTASTAGSTSSAASTADNTQKLSQYQDARPHGHHHHGGMENTQSAQNSGQNSSTGSGTSSASGNFMSVLQQYEAEGSGAASSTLTNQLLSVFA